MADADAKLGEQLDALKLGATPSAAEGAAEGRDLPDNESTQTPTSPTVEKKGAVADGAKKETTTKKKEQYVNPDRFLTGGAQRDKLSEEELTERMARIREQNEKIKQRRLDVQADEDAFKKTQEADRAKRAKDHKIQEGIDRAREQNARRKMEKIQGREWDSGKKGAVPKTDVSEASAADGATDGPASSPPPTRGRGGGSGRGRGRSGRGGKVERSGSSPIVAEAGASTETAANVSSDGQPVPTATAI